MIQPEKASQILNSLGCRTTLAKNTPQYRAPPRCAWAELLSSIVTQAFASLKLARADIRTEPTIQKEQHGFGYGVLKPQDQQRSRRWKKLLQRMPAPPGGQVRHLLTKSLLSYIVPAGLVLNCLPARKSQPAAPIARQPVSELCSQVLGNKKRGEQSTSCQPRRSVTFQLLDLAEMIASRQVELGVGRPSDRKQLPSNNRLGLQERTRKLTEANGSQAFSSSSFSLLRLQRKLIASVVPLRGPLRLHLRFSDAARSLNTGLRRRQYLAKPKRVLAHDVCYTRYVRFHKLTAEWPRRRKLGHYSA